MKHEPKVSNYYKSFAFNILTLSRICSCKDKFSFTGLPLPPKLTRFPKTSFEEGLLFGIAEEVEDDGDEEVDEVETA